MFLRSGYPSQSASTPSEEENIAKGSPPIAQDVAFASKPIKKSVYKRGLKLKAKADAFCMPMVKKVLEMASRPGDKDLLKDKLVSCNSSWVMWLKARQKDYPFELWENYFFTMVTEMRQRIEKQILENK